MHPPRGLPGYETDTLSLQALGACSFVAEANMLEREEHYRKAVVQLLDSKV